jgi:hypothetical protein
MIVVYSKKSKERTMEIKTVKIEENIIWKKKWGGKNRNKEGEDMKKIFEEQNILGYNVV